MLGEAHFKLGQLIEAEHWYKEALRAKADHIPAHLTYGKLLAKTVGIYLSSKPNLTAQTIYFLYFLAQIATFHNNFSFPNRIHLIYHYKYLPSIIYFLYFLMAQIVIFPNNF